MPIASSPAGVIQSSTARPSSSLRQTVLSALSAGVCRSVTSSRARPRARSAPTTLTAAPPRSEPGSGSRLPSARCAAAESMIAWVSESLVIGSSLRCEARDHPDPATTPSRASADAAAAEGDRQLQLGEDRKWRPSRSGREARGMPLAVGLRSIRQPIQRATAASIASSSRASEPLATSSAKCGRAD